VSIWLADARDFQPVNEVYREYMGTADRPCRSVFVVGFMFGCRIEIKAIAYKPL
jgi:enamine deaminase RidA (YjgF/YER057c/UK114 family)